MPTTDGLDPAVDQAALIRLDVRLKARRPGIGDGMPWILKALLLVAKTKRGRKLLFAGALAAVEAGQSQPARKLYGKARTGLRNPRPREARR